MIHVENLSRAFAGRDLFSPASFVISGSERVGIVGPNGAGKTTLLKIIAGLDKPSSGRVSVSGEIGYLRQESDVRQDLPLREEMWRAFPEIEKLRARTGEIERLMWEKPESAEQNADELDRAHDRLRLLDAAGVESTIDRVLAGLNFSRDDHHRPCGDFSGGWRMRISLAKILAARPGHILLDEPTNHLDTASRDWLAGELAQYHGAILIVTHDGEFLDRVATRILSFENNQIVHYTGNFSAYLTERGTRRAHATAASDRQAREIARQERFIERFRSKATKARQVQSRIKALDRVERIKAPAEDRATRFQIKATGRAERIVLRVEGLSHLWDGTPALLDVGFEVERGTRVALVGPNGGGKSTLLRILSGEVTAAEGKAVWSEHARPAYYSQHQDETLDPAATVLEETRKAAGDQPDSAVRGILGRFLFSGDDVFKAVSILSGGEKSRVALAKFLVRPTNVLLLDEPTNHLDASTRAELLEALREYDGTIICASHDPAIVDEIATHVYRVDAGEVSLQSVRDDRLAQPAQRAKRS